LAVDEAAISKIGFSGCLGYYLMEVRRRIVLAVYLDGDGDRTVRFCL
jgi:hypothetical protein